MKNKVFGIIVLLIALILSGSAAFYSVIGLSKIFAAASLQVIIMAGSMEVGKLVVATMLHNYWNEIEWKLKIYLTFSVIVLMVITSAGIYGLLSASYQETATKDKISDREIQLLETKLDRYTDRQSELKKQREILSRDISELRDALSNNVIRYTDRESGNEVVTTSSSNRRAYQNQLDITNTQKNELDQSLSNIEDSITQFDIAILNLQNSSDVNSELLPLKYISNISGVEMDYVVNLFILLLIIVFDPLAIALILSANILFNLKVNRDQVDNLQSTNSIDLPVQPEQGEESNFDIEAELQGKSEQEIKETVKEAIKDSTESESNDILDDYINQLNSQKKKED